MRAYEIIGINQELSQEFDLIETTINHLARRNQVEAEVIW